METAIQTFVYISTIIFCFWYLIWSTNNWMNFWIKASFFGMSAFGIVLSGKLMGLF